MFKSELHCCLCRFGGCAYSSIVYFQENMIMFSEIFIINCTYGNATVKRSMTMKVHQLQHLPMFVEAFGPLWAFSCFPYENSNGQVKGLVHGTYKIHCITGLYNIVYIRPVSAFFFFILFLASTFWEIAGKNIKHRASNPQKKITKKKDSIGFSEMTLKLKCSLLPVAFCEKKIIKIFHKPSA